MAPGPLAKAPEKQPSPLFVWLGLVTVTHWRLVAGQGRDGPLAGRHRGSSLPPGAHPRANMHMAPEVDTTAPMARMGKLRLRLDSKVSEPGPSGARTTSQVCGLLATSARPRDAVLCLRPGLPLQAQSHS